MSVRPVLARALLVVFLFASAEGVAYASTSRPIGWEELIDPVKGRYDDPFAALQPSQLRSLGIVLRAREGLKDPGLSRDEKAALKSELSRHEALLQVAGIDADGLLKRRKAVALEKAKASLAANPKLEGQEVTISGYVIPLFDPQGQSLGGYVVPQAGMCSHMPPPAPNQMIHYAQTQLVAGDYVYQPVQITGRLHNKVSRREINLLDGEVEMISVFEMQVTKSKVIEETEPDPSTRTFNLFSPLKRLFKSGTKQ